ncbi:hypothetical protein [Dendrosporobacter sp. 1207_IL3150]|uniref:hypothetical protein n=1 Tax=Dendrosporobacter sp. 1207_IL3150 TaxID=3084054 RepID=UPI002FDB7B80
MGQLFRVAVQYKNDNGFIEYDTDTKEINVILKDESKRSEVEKYLTTEHVINAPQNTLLDFKKCLITPVNNVEDLKLALTRLWQTTGVHVDWSRPV